MAINDIILTIDGQVQEQNGDFLTGVNDNNLMYYNVVSHKGHWRTAPTIGAGVDKYLNASILPTVIERDIKSNLKNDVFGSAEVNAREFPKIVINRELVIDEG